ncbi:hypothetical protein [Priestia megaterium]|uniref:hypothetical protein n=1 Tax=Priestia megaterium TaxID=1404 RepID=UPI001155D88D|nr:hypothetical protein [Priestia megaterium]
MMKQDKHVEEYLELLDAEIKMLNARLESKLGSGVVEEIDRLMDEALTIAVREQLNNLATYESQIGGN